MENEYAYVVLSLELHLFFARIMKEHSLFLEAGFTPVNANYSKDAEYYKKEFESLLSHTVKLSDGVIRANVLRSGEIITEFTGIAEMQTQQFTGICIDNEITMMESRLRCNENSCLNSDLVQQVRWLNQTAIQLLNGLISFKENIIQNVRSCRMFTMNYPLLLEHILREAKLYRTYVMNYENNCGFDFQSTSQIELFWNQIMMEHALFIRGLLDPTENELIETSDSFAKDYARLLEQSKEMNDRVIQCNTKESLAETLKFREFKIAGTKGIEECQIRSVILPLLADHVLREANHYIRLLNE